MKALFKARFRQLKNVLRGVGVRQYALFLLLSAAMLGVMIFLFLKVFGFLFYREEFPLYFKLFLSEKILMMTFLTMFMMLILSALISTLNIFFLSRDLELLLSSPMSSRSVFAWKAVEVTASSSLMVIFFSMPVLFGYCYYFAPSLPAIFAVVTVFLLYTATGVLLGILVGLTVPAFISVRRLQPVLSVVSIVFISGVVIFLRILRPEQLGNPEVVNNLMDYMKGLSVDGMWWLPFFWISRALHLAALGDAAGYFKMAAAFAGGILLLLGFIYFLQKKYYLKLFDKLNKGSGGTYCSSWRPARFPDSDYGALWKKEIKSFIRTPAQWSQLLIIAAIMIVFVLNIKGIPLPHASVKNLIAFLNLGMAAFVVAGLNSRFTFTTIPMENPGITHLIAAPFTRRKILRFKLLFYAVPQFLVGIGLFIAGDLALGMDAFSRYSGLFFLLPVLPFLTLLSLFFGLKVDSGVPLTPQHLVGSRHGISYMLWSLLYIVAGMAYFARPMFLFYYNQFMGRPLPVLEIGAWFAVFLLLHLLLMGFIYKRCVVMWERKEF